MPPDVSISSMAPPLKAVDVEFNCTPSTSSYIDSGIFTVEREKKRPLSTSSSEALGSKDVKETKWAAIYLLAAICTFSGIQFSVFFAALYPFIDTVDPTAGATFFGIITSSYAFGQAVSSPLFGYWMNKSKSVRPPLTTGIILMAVSNFIFCFVENFQETSRRYVMLFSRFFIGIGAGMVGVMRAYVSTASVDQDRPRAVAIIQASYMIGFTIGPGVQTALSPLGFPGITFFSFFHLNQYTAPALLSSTVNAISLVLLYVYLEEDYAGLDEFADDQEPDMFSILPEYDKIATLICVITQFSFMFIITNIETVGSMYTEVMFAWSDEQATKYNGLLQVVAGSTSLLTCVVYAWKIGSIVSRRGMERLVTMFGIFLMMLYFILTYPWPFIGDVITYKNAISEDGRHVRVGCDPIRFPWCGHTHQVILGIWITMELVAMAVAIPLINVSMNTLFSRILGGRRQGVFQGILLMSGSSARTAGPLLISFLFSHFGPEVTWALEFTVLALTLLIWIIGFRRMVPLKTNANPGDYLRMPNEGAKYRL